MSDKTGSPDYSNYKVDTGYNARITALEKSRLDMADSLKATLARVSTLEQQVANQAVMEKALRDSVKEMSNRERPLYGPLRSDAGAIARMSNFIRHLASVDFQHLTDFYGWQKLRDLVNEADQILKDLT